MYSDMMWQPCKDVLTVWRTIFVQDWLHGDGKHVHLW